MNKNLLILIVLLISCYLILNIKETFQGSEGSVGIKYYEYIDDFNFIGDNLPNESINHLNQNQIDLDSNVKDLGECMEECEKKNNCYSFKYYDSTTSNQKSCAYYSNKVLDNNIQNNIQSCTRDNCYYNKKNGITIPYDDMNQNDTKRFRKNEKACHPDTKKSFIINTIPTDLQPTASDGFIKQCSDKCRQNSNCKSFTIFNNTQNESTGPEFKCKYYNELCSQGTNASNNLNRHEVYASYDIYDCGEFECRKNINASDPNDSSYNIYCNNNKYRFYTCII